MTAALDTLIELADRELKPILAESGKVLCSAVYTLRPRASLCSRAQPGW